MSQSESAWAGSNQLSTAISKITFAHAGARSKVKNAAFGMALACLYAGSPVMADEVELKSRIEKLQQQLETQAPLLQNLQSQINTLSEQQKKSSAAQSGNAAGSDTSIGGYGEISYNNYANDSSRNIADMKRFVLFVGHRFNDQLSFNSELEWEHAVASAADQGETEVEQAYINYQFANEMNLKTGLFLMPFGFINQSHEPPVFYGVERNEVETRIIPSTWREGGIGLSGNTEQGLAWEAGIVTGFDTAKFDDASAPLAASHQELQFAKAHDLAFYGALNYRGTPGLTIGGAMFSGDSMQGNTDFKTNTSQPDFTGIGGRTTLWEMHARWQKNGWDLQALYAKGTIADANRIDDVLLNYNNTSPSARPYVPSAFYGWLMHGAYTVWQRGEMSVTPFVRHEEFNAQSEMPSGFGADPANADRITTLGLSFKPHPQVVFKADLQKYRDNPDNNRFNLGLGYMF